MTYCHVPWTHIDISPMGEISPCCKFKNSLYKNKAPNINEITIDQYINSPTLKQVKKDFTNGVWPAGCERCKIEEQNGIESKRLVEYKRWSDQLNDHQNKGFLSASIAFGNACNLTCITCDPTSSSKWYQEYKKLYGISIKPNLFYKEGFVENFYDNTHNLLHLDIPGGEPLLSGTEQQKELLERFVKDNRAKDITLHYNTNCTLFPDNTWLDLWQEFKQVDIQLSIDGIGKRFDYIRHPADWNIVSKNAKKYQELKNLKLSISTTVSAYNIAYLDELLSWAKQEGFDNPYLGRVHNPTHLRPTVWKQKAKQYIIDRLSNSNHITLEPFINLMMNEDDSRLFDDFRYRLLRHDQYRSLNFKDTFPEMFNFLSE